MFDESAQNLAHARRILDQHLRPAVHRDRVPLHVTAWRAPDEPVPFTEGASAPHSPIAPGALWGEPWSTWWFELRGSVPESHCGQIVEAVIDLGFSSATPGFQAEGLLYDASGTPLKGIHPRNRWWRVTDAARGGEDVQLHLEAAGNPDVMARRFAPTQLGHASAKAEAAAYRLGACELAVFDPEVFALAMDLDVLTDLAEQLPSDDPRRAEICTTLADALHHLDVHAIADTAGTTRNVLAPALTGPARPAAQRVTAVGHAHLDSAWLWPVRETRRKAARTFANATMLAEHYPELVFACSSARQYAWVREDHPALWERIKAAAAQGHWEPVGGMWVEAGAVLPSGESLVRQHLIGQAFFEREFGMPCRGVWLPDSFGYSGNYPQIARLTGAEWFLTQKISWNDTNTFPHHTFWWEGIDGTRILTHFPPADTYESDLSGADLARSQREFRENGRSREALIPFGYGDGGGGPEREMLERARRLAALDGSPAVRVGTVQSFFDRVREEYADQAPVWSGELYLELHRGTLTSQRAMKAGCRATEALLRQAEQVWTMVALQDRGAWPAQFLRECWESLLLLQFHDILPGSAIAWVHDEARAEYDHLEQALTQLIADGLTRLGGGIVNASPYARREVIETGAGLALVVPLALAIGQPPIVEPAHPVSTLGATLTNGLVSLTVDAAGRIVSVIDHRHSDRELIPPGLSAGLRLHPDVPAKWDAWDLDKTHSRSWSEPTEVTVALTGATPLRTEFVVTGTIGASPFTQHVGLDADSSRINLSLEIDWRESERALAAYLPIALLATHSRSEIQFGHVTRPTHENTTWEAAKFEMVAHRWLHVAEPAPGGWGVGLINQNSYGHSVVRSSAAGAPVSTLRLTLLRSPSFPDPDTDAGPQVVRWSFVPGASLEETIEHGYAVHLPLVGDVEVPHVRDVVDTALTDEAWGTGGAPALQVSDAGVVVEWIKLAEDGAGDVIVRIYEAFGGTRTAMLTTAFAFTDALETDLREGAGSSVVAERPALREVRPAERSVLLSLAPFQLVTLRFTRSGCGGEAAQHLREQTF